MSEQGVDEWSSPRSTQDQQQSKDQQEDENRQEPPALVLLHEAPQFTEKAGAARVRGGLFKLIGILIHSPLNRGSILSEIGGNITGSRFRIPETLLVGGGAQAQLVSA